MTAPKAKRSLVPWIILGVIVVMLLTCGGVAVLAIRQWMRTMASEQDRMHCQQNLNQIAIALEVYDTQNKGYPPSVTKDAKGQPMHSWRALVLPNLDTKSKDDDLAKRYDLKQPWNSATNVKLASEMPPVFGCPCDPAGWTSHTSYVGVVDPQTGLLGYRPAGWQAADVAAATKILILELPESGIAWLEPHDLVPGTPEAGALLDRAFLYGHYGGTHVLFDDGTIKVLKGNELDSLLKALR